MKLDLGCGPRKQAGYEGVDSRPFEGVDHLVDLRQPWPWTDQSIEAVHSSHFIEHLTQLERVHFWNELYRVLQPGKQALIIAPHWSHSCAYGDPTHQWPPMTEWAVYYLNKAWRDQNAPHDNDLLTCDFDYVVGGSWDGWLQSRSQSIYEFAMGHYTNSWRDLHITLTKRA